MYVGLIRTFEQWIENVMRFQLFEAGLYAQMLIERKESKRDDEASYRVDS